MIELGVIYKAYNCISFVQTSFIFFFYKFRCTYTIGTKSYYLLLFFRNRHY